MSCMICPCCGYQPDCEEWDVCERCGFGRVEVEIEDDDDEEEDDE